MRGAIRTLEEVGFLDRAVTTGSTHRPTPNGLHRKPVLFMFERYDLAIAVAAVFTCQRDEIGGEPLFVLSAPRRFALGRASWPSARQARRSETFSTDRMCSTQARRRAGLRSFPGQPPAGSACRA